MTREKKEGSTRERSKAHLVFGNMLPFGAVLDVVWSIVERLNNRSRMLRARRPPSACWQRLCPFSHEKLFPKKMLNVQMMVQMHKTVYCCGSLKIKHAETGTGAETRKPTDVGGWIKIRVSQKELA